MTCSPGCESTYRCGRPSRNSSTSERRRRQQSEDILDRLRGSVRVDPYVVGAAIEVICGGRVQPPQVLRLPRRQRFGIHCLDVGQRQQRQHLQSFGRGDLLGQLCRSSPDRRCRGAASSKTSPGDSPPGNRPSRHRPSRVAGVPPRSARTAGCCRRGRNPPDPCRCRAAARPGTAVPGARSPRAVRRTAAMLRRRSSFRRCSISIASSVCSSTV